MSRGHASPQIYDSLVIINTYFHAFIHLWFKHALLDTQHSYLGCLSRTDSLGPKRVVYVLNKNKMAAVSKDIFL